MLCMKILPDFGRAHGYIRQPIRNVAQTAKIDMMNLAMSCLTSHTYKWASLVAQTVNHRPVVQETWVRSLGWEDPLEKEMATHSRTLAWKILWTEEA